MMRLKKFIIKEAVISETTTVVYGKNEAQALDFYRKDINSLPKMITENKSISIQPTGGI